MNLKTTKPYIAAIGMIILASGGPVIAADEELPELRSQNKQLTERVAKQTAEIKELKSELEERDKSIAALQQQLQQNDAAPTVTSSTNAPKLSIQKPFDKIAITTKEGEAFQGTYIRLFSTRFNDVESSNLEFVFKKHGSKVVREDRFDPFSIDGLTKNYKIEIRYETEGPRSLATCNLIKRILEERYGLDDVPIIHDSQYTYKGHRRYIEVYICEGLAEQTLEFKDKKLPLRFW